jgi:hypothetical protein
MRRKQVVAWSFIVEPHSGLAPPEPMLEEIRAERNAWREQSQKLARPKPEAKVSWWRWLRSTG